MSPMSQKVAPVTVSPADLSVVKEFVTLGQVLARVLAVSDGRARRSPSALALVPYTGPERRGSERRAGAYRGMSYAGPVKLTRNASRTVEDAPGTTMATAGRPLYVYWAADARKRPQLPVAQSAVYAAIIKAGGKHMAVDEIATRAKRPAPSVRQMLNGLVSKGVLARAIEDVA